MAREGLTRRCWEEKPLPLGMGTDRKRLSEPGVSPSDHEGKGPSVRTQGRKEPLQRAGPGGVQLVTAPAAAPAGPRQGEEGASVSDLAGMACPQRPEHAHGRAVGNDGWCRARSDLP